MTHYNTNNETGETLLESKEKAQRQEDCIMRYFMMRTFTILNCAPHDLEFLFNPKVPITSIRRALTNLKKEGKLRKTDFKVMGTYGRMVHTWQLASRQTELEL